MSYCESIVEQENVYMEEVWKEKKCKKNNFVCLSSTNCLAFSSVAFIFCLTTTSFSEPAYATAPNTQIGKIDLSGGAPSWIAMTPDGKHLYVTQPDTRSVAIIDTTTNTQVGFVRNLSGDDPCSMAISPNGKTAYVAHCGSNEATVSIVDLASNAEVGTVTGLPSTKTTFSSVAFSPNGAFAYVTAYDYYPGMSGDDPTGLKLYVIDAHTNQKINESNLYCGWLGCFVNSQKVVFSPDGKTAYVSFLYYQDTAFRGATAVIDTSSHTETAYLNAQSSYDASGIMQLGSMAVVRPDSKTIYTEGSYPIGGDLSVRPIAIIDAATHNKTDEILGGDGYPRDMVFTPDGKAIYVANICGSNILVMDGATYGSLGSVTNYTGKLEASDCNLTQTYTAKLTALAITPDGKTLYVANPGSKDVSVVDIPGATAVIADSGVSPSVGQEGGRTKVSIRGSHLLGTTSVLFGGVPATNVTPVSDEEVTATSPPHSVGPVDVTVVNPGGNATLPKGFTYTTAQQN